MFVICFLNIQAYEIWCILWSYLLIHEELLCRSKLNARIYFVGRFFVFLTEVKITVTLILRSKTRICRKINFCNTV